MATVLVGTLGTVGAGIALAAGALFVRRRLLPGTLNVNLPPSGAHPWKRTRGANLPGEVSWSGELARNQGQMTPPAIPPPGFALPTPVLPTSGVQWGYPIGGFPASIPTANSVSGFQAPASSPSYVWQYPQPDNGLSAPVNNTHIPTNSLPSANGGFTPAVVPPVQNRQGPSRRRSPLVRLEPDSESIPALPITGQLEAQQFMEGSDFLDDPLVQETLKHYIPEGEKGPWKPGT